MSETMKKYIEEAEQDLLHTYNRYQIVLDKGDGVYLYDIDGKKYLDFVSGIAVFALGYNNKAYNDALKAQIDKLLHTSNYYYNVPAIEAARKIKEVSGMDRVFFTNSGAEAVEGAIKAARKYAFLKDGKTDHEIIAMNHSFHGRTFGALSVTGNPHYREAFEPMIGNIRFADLNDFDSVLANVNDKTCAIIMETVQGEGGIYPATEEFLKNVRKLCDEKNILLILDEIQCGMGRTGYMYAWQRYDVKPDIMTTAKALGCGVPVGAFLLNKKAADNSLVAGDHGTTYGGNPFACAAISKVLDLFKEDNIIENVNEVAPYLEKRLDELKDKYDFITDRRGLGLMQGLVFDRPVSEIINKALEKGLILINAGSDIIRFVPPLVISKENVDDMIRILDFVSGVYMNLRIRIISIILIICALAGIAVYARSERSVFEDYSLFPANKTTVRLWYTDDSLTPYLQSRAVSFSESHNKIRLEPVLVSGLEYLEAINSASVNEEGFPDLFITTNDSLEKAYLAGLAMEIENGGTYLDPKVFPQAAVNSVTYKDKLIAYPFYFETSSLIYNKTYLENMAVETMQSQIDAAEGLEAQENADAAVAQGSEPDEDAESDAASSEESTEITQGMIDEAVAESLPLNISDILKFAETYTAPEEVEAVFKWDVTDIFYNFFFVGNYMNTGGKAGDDISQLDIYNTDTISCMKIYQQLNQIFAIDADSINYDSMVSDFIAGKTVFTVATTDIIKRIEDAKASGECKFEFAVADMPGLTDNFGTRTMSVTECIVVNGYTENIAEANAAARYLCNDASGDIYNMAGKVAAHYGVNYDNPNLDTFVDVYADSVPMPKTIETSNLWMELEIAFTKIWNGADCNDTLRQVSENIMTQVTGSPYTVEKIPDPQDVDLTADLVEESD